MMNLNAKAIKFYLEIVVYILLVSLATFSTDIYLPSLMVMQKYFNASIHDSQATLVYYLLGFSCCMFFCGILSDLLGTKRVLLVGLTVYILVSWLCIYATSIHEIEIYRFLQGLSGCSGTILARVIVRNFYPANTAVKILSYLTSGMAIALAFSPVLGAILVKQFSWHISFVMMMLYGTIVLGGCYFIPHLKPSRRLNFNFYHYFYNILKHYSLALKSKEFVVHTLVISCSWANFFLILLEYPFLLMHQQKYTLHQFGVIVTFIMLGYFLGSFITRKLMQKNINRNHIVLIGILVMLLGGAIGINALFLSTEVFTIILPPFIFLIGVSIVMPQSQYAAVADPKVASSSSTGLIYFIEMLSTAIFTNVIKNSFHPSFALIWVSLLLSTGLLAIVFYATIMIKIFKFSALRAKISLS